LIAAKTLFQSGPGFVGKSQDVIEFISYQIAIEHVNDKKPLQRYELMAISKPRRLPC